MLIAYQQNYENLDNCQSVEFALRLRMDLF